jgi:putative peptidoglycan lipid II flippase
LIYSAPLFLPYFAAQLNVIIEKSLASTLKIGSISIIDYARKFSDIPLEVLITTIVTFLVPLLSSQFARENKASFSDEFKKIYQLGMLILIGIISLLTACPHAFVNVLYSKGDISPTTLTQISNITMLYGWSMFSVFHYQIFGAALMSSKNGRTYAFFGVVAQFTMILLNVVLYRSVGIYIFPITLLLSHAISASLMFVKVPFSGNEVKKVMLKYSLILIAISSIMFFVNYLFVEIASGILLITFNLMLVSTLMIGSFVLFKMDERAWLRYVYRIVSRKI